MVLAVLAANLGAQKHDADSRLAHGRARSLVGTTGVCANLDPPNSMTCRDQTPRKLQISRSVGEVGLARRAALGTNMANELFVNDVATALGAPIMAAVGR
jgi:hypothetical protein